MHNQQAFGTQGQRLPALGIASSAMRDLRKGGKLLGNEAVQLGGRLIDYQHVVTSRIDIMPLSVPLTEETPLSRLEALKKQKFTPEGKAERVARALAALHQETPIKLPPGEWVRIVEDIDMEDQF